jgi:Ca2+/Na+ antiporter
MAISGLFGGQMFNFLMGFSLGSLLKYFGPGTHKTFSMFKFDDLVQGKDKEGLITFVVLIWAMMTLIILMFVLKFSE